MTLYLSDDDVRIAYRTIRVFSRLWDEDNKKKQHNYSGMRAAFRRWQPDTPISVQMRQYVWAYTFKRANQQENKPLSDSDTKWNEFFHGLDLMNDKMAIKVDYAATIAALYAAAGSPPLKEQNNSEEASTDEQAEKSHKNTFGEALWKAELSDMRLMRFVTTSTESRVAALHRLMRFLKSKGVPFEWSWKEIANILQFLFGAPERAEHSADTWARQFFAARSQGNKKEEAAETEAEPAQ